MEFCKVRYMPGLGSEKNKNREKNKMDMTNNKNIKGKVSVVCGLVLAAMAGGGVASANVALEFNNSGSPITYLPRLVTYSQASPTLQVPDFAISSITGTSNAGLGGSVSQLEENTYSIANTSNSTASLIIALSDVNFTGSGPATLAETGSVTFLTGTAGDSVGLTSYLNQSDVQFGVGNAISANEVVLSAGATPNTTYQIAPAMGLVNLGANALFSLTTVVDLKMAAGSSINLTFQTTAGPNAMPTPATDGLCATGILGFAVLALRRRAAKRIV